MAEQALKKLEEQLQCPICLETYTEPKLLQCNHIYCQGCLDKLVVRDRYGRPYLHCPACRQVTAPPLCGVRGLPTAFQVNSLLEIQESLKGATKPVSSSEAGGSAATKSSYFCSQHPEEELKLFCETCQELICFKCAIRTGKHSSHSYDELPDALEKCKEEIASLLGPLETQLNTITKAVEKLDIRCSEISEQRAGIEATIHDSIRRFHELLEVRKTELISQLDQATQGKLQSLSVQRDELETNQVQLMSCVNFMKLNLSNSSEAEVLKMKSFMVKQVEQLTVTIEPEDLEPNTEADMDFQAVAVSDITTACQNYGWIVESTVAAMASLALLTPLDESASSKSVHAVLTASLEESGTVEPFHATVKARYADLPSQEAAAVLDTTDSTNSVNESFLPDPLKCFLTGENLESADVDKPSIVILHAVTSNSEVCQGPIDSIECKVVSDIADSSIKCSVQMIGIGQYEIRYKPTMKGKHYLHIKINGKYIAGSPSPFVVTSSILKLGRLLSNITNIRKPWGVVINQRGEIMVSEHDGHCISVFSPNGWKLRSFGSHGNGHSQFNNPRGLALDAEGNIVVTDYKNHRIQKFTIDGRYLNAVGSKGSGRLQFKGPKNIAFNAFNNKFYVVDENNRVQVITSDFSYCDVFGKIGWGEGQFSDPWGIACDSSGNVYVADSTSNRIQMFSSEGQFVRLFGKRGGAPGHLNFPSDIAFDSTNLCLYVSERYNHRVSVFDSEGDFITCFGSFGVNPGEFKYPRGLTVDSSGVVYVCDNNNNRLSLF